MRASRPELFLASSLACLVCCARPSYPPGPAEVARDAVFTRYTPLSRSAEIGRRVLTPLTFAAGQEAIGQRKQELREQMIDLSKESFSIYVPPGAPPPEGWGLLVFIAPWDQPTRPKSWRAALTRRRMVFVSAAESGNEKSVLDRRIPLALLAWENMRAELPIDPARVYVGGMSGGSRVSEIVAMGWPDVFRGALLNAGSEPIAGENGMYLPAADLFHRFQRSRLVYVTGEHDAENLETDRASRNSMHGHCVFDVETLTARQLGHEPLDSISMERALDALDRRSPIDEQELTRCNAHLEGSLEELLREAEAALARGDGREARAKLLDVDRRFAGLATRQILSLDAKIRAGG